MSARLSLSPPEAPPFPVYVAAMPTARKRKTRAPPTPRRRPPGLEYRAKSDGSWYSVRLALQEGSLRVMYEEFLEATDEWYDPPAAGGDLASPRDVAALRARFRAVSTALEGARCRDLRPGARLCVGCDIVVGELKFYDAVLDSVRPSFFPFRCPHYTFVTHASYIY